MLNCAFPMVEALRDGVSWIEHLVFPDALQTPSDSKLRSVSHSTIDDSWVMFMAIEYLATVVLGSLILIMTPRAKTAIARACGGYELVHGGHRSSWICSQRLLYVLVFSCVYVTTVSLSLYSVQRRALSQQFGFDLEVWTVMLSLNCVWLLVQATLAVCSCRAGAGYSSTAFLEASFVGTAPVISATYNTGKDCMLAGLCLLSEKSLIRIMGYASFAYVGLVHIGFLLSEQLVLELAASYASVLHATTIALEQPEEEAHASEGDGLKCLAILYKQTAPGKRQVLLWANGFQIVAAMIYMFAEGGSVAVALLNVCIPLAQYAFALAFFRILSRRASPWFFDQLQEAIADGQDAKIQVLLSRLVDMSKNNSSRFLELYSNVTETETKCLLGAPVAELLRDGNAQVRSAAVSTMGRLGPQAGSHVAPQVAALLKDEKESTRQAAVLALVQLGPEGAGRYAFQVAELLKDQNEVIRKTATSALQQVGPEVGATVAPQVAELLKDAQESVRLSAASIVGSLGPEGGLCVATRVAELLKSGSPEVRKTAAAAGVNVAFQVVESLKNENEDVRNTAALTLLQLGPDAGYSVAHHLAELTKHENKSVRKAAVSLLGQLGPQAGGRFAPQVTELLKEEDEDIRNAATSALLQLGPEAAFLVKSQLSRLSKQGSEHTQQAADSVLRSMRPSIVESGSSEKTVRRRISEVLQL
eukprot:TRINITY_DN107135_c0_g1_i1.p1 TRINITY_DN107135_c0_g1~~TRINITY_DN107135_c0_g1_i1.p1  ORF type:complete len:702 (+),score=112.26 TRINITY_DN107135_c0_g1_i1:11-2116(+)